MKSTRRDFLQKSALFLGASAMGSSALANLAGKKSKHLIGVQLYSVREDMKKDPMGTLTQIAQMGSSQSLRHRNVCPSVWSKSGASSDVASASNCQRRVAFELFWIPCVCSEQTAQLLPSGVQHRTTHVS